MDRRMDPRWDRGLWARSRFDVPAFVALQDRHLARIHAFVARRVADPAAAEAVTAATFERAFGIARRDGFGREPIGASLHRLASAAVAEWVRRRGANGDGDEAAARAFGAALGRAELRRALFALPETQRRLIVLRFFDGLAPDELCAVLECSHASLDVRLRRALRALHDAAAHEAIDAA
jgi:RNA polymerase sigma-70 factor (ECF subfamily)